MRAPTARRSIGPTTPHRSLLCSEPRRSPNYDLAKLVPFIDWSPFFATWELTGRYPMILDDNKVGPEARKLYQDAQEMLQRIVTEKWLTASAVIGFWPANSDGDDIVLYRGEERTEELARLHTLRQQVARQPGRDRAHVALADFVAPKDSGRADYIGGFRGDRGARRGRGAGALHCRYR